MSFPYSIHIRKEKDTLHSQGLDFQIKFTWLSTVKRMDGITCKTLALNMCSAKHEKQNNKTKAHLKIPCLKNTQPRHVRSHKT